MRIYDKHVKPKKVEVLDKVLIKKERERAVDNNKKGNFILKKDLNDSSRLGLRTKYVFFLN